MTWFTIQLCAFNHVIAKIPQRPWDAGTGSVSTPSNQQIDIRTEGGVADSGKA